MSPATQAVRKTSLYETHQQKGAKLVPFAGVYLPVWFSSIQDEHEAVRTRSGCFDISHMGLLSISGPDADSFLQQMACNDIRKSQKGKMVYSMILNSQGGILDDVMIGGNEDELIMVVNASNKAKIMEWLKAHQSKTVQIKDLNQEYDFIAVQGPQAVAHTAALFGSEINQIPRFGMAQIKIQDSDMRVFRTGYTGEDGVELMVPNRLTEYCWRHLVGAGVTPCGLGARDTLRIQAGLPLYGQELSETITPLMTRYPWVIAWETDFIGKAALEAAKGQEPMTTVGIQMKGRQIPRTGYEVQEGGQVLSGTLVPGISTPIGMALVNRENAEVGTTLHVMIRNQVSPATVVALPFK